MNQLLREKASQFEAEPASVAELKLKCITVIKTMLEDNSERSLKLAMQILIVLDIETIFENMVFCLCPFFKKKKKKKKKPFSIH